MHYPNVHKLATTSSQQCSKHACVLTKTRFCTFCAKLHEARTQQRLLPLLVSMNRIMGGFLVRGGTSEQTVQNLMEKQLAREAAAAVTARAERIGRTAAKAAARDLLTEDAAGRRARAAAGAQAAMAAAGNMLAAAADDEEEESSSNSNSSGTSDGSTRSTGSTSSSPSVGSRGSRSSSRLARSCSSSGTTRLRTTQRR